MLVRKFDEDHVLGIVEKLGGFIVDVAKKDSRDIYAIGLKTIIRSLDEQVECITTTYLCRVDRE